MTKSRILFCFIAFFVFLRSPLRAEPVLPHLFSDHMVRRYEQSFLPLERIDSTGFMIGNTGTIYYRKTNAWKGMLLLMLARGGWVNTIHGNIEFLDEEKAKWF